MSEHPPRRIHGAWLAASIGLAACVRFVGLGRQGPWLDEAANWDWAREWGLHLRPIGVSALTYLLEAVSFQLFGESAWALRLPSALLSVASLALLAWALDRHVGRKVALVATTWLALSPFHVHYAQDGNHYAGVMAGVAAALVASLLVARERPPWGPVALLALLALGARWFQPLGGLGALGAAAAVWFECLRRPTLLSPDPARHAPVRWALAGLAVLAALIALGFAARELLHPAPRLSFPSARTFGLNWNFWGAALGDLWGAFLHHRPADAVLGVLATLLSAAGWWSLVRRRPELRALAVCAAVVVSVELLYFTLIPFNRYFHSRYLAPMLLPLVVGAAAALSELAGGARAGRGVALCVLALLVQRASVYHGQRSGGEIQPMPRAIAWIDVHTEPDSVIATRHVYTSRAFRLQWTAQPHGNRTHLALDPTYATGAVAIQQIQEALQQGHPVYCLSAETRQEMQSPDWAAFVGSRSTVAARFASSVPDDFMPVDLGIEIRKFAPGHDGLDPLAMPRDGRHASAWSPPIVDPSLSFRPEGPTRILAGGESMTFTIRPPAAAMPLAVRVALTPGKAGDRAALVAFADRRAVALWDLSGLSPAIQELAVGDAIPPGTARLDLLLLNPPTSTRLEVLDVALQPGRGVAVAGRRMREDDRTARLTGDGPTLRLRRITEELADDGKTPASAQRDAGEFPPSKGPRLVTLDWWPRGTGDLAFLPSLSWQDADGKDPRTANPMELPMGRPMAWNPQPVVAGWVAWEPGGAILLKYRLKPVLTGEFTPRDRRLDLGALRVFFPD